VNSPTNPNITLHRRLPSFMYYSRPCWRTGLARGKGVSLDDTMFTRIGARSVLSLYIHHSFKEEIQLLQLVSSRGICSDKSKRDFACNSTLLLQIAQLIEIASMGCTYSRSIYDNDMKDFVKLMKQFNPGSASGSERLKSQRLERPLCLRENPQEEENSHEDQLPTIIIFSFFMFHGDWIIVHSLISGND